jgi:hypothetical protein
MSQRAVTSLPMAFEVLKAMRKGRPWIGARVIVQSAPQRVLSTDLLTELGDIELNVPGPAATARARRTREIDRVILAGFVLGLSTRKVGETLVVPIASRVLF